VLAWVFEPRTGTWYRAACSGFFRFGLLPGEFSAGWTVRRAAGDGAFSGGRNRRGVGRVRRSRRRRSSRAAEAFSVFSGGQGGFRRPAPAEVWWMRFRAPHYGPVGSVRMRHAPQVSPTPSDWPLRQRFFFCFWPRRRTGTTPAKISFRHRGLARRPLHVIKT